MPKKPSLNFEPGDFFKDLSFDLERKFANESKVKNIMEFIESELDHEAWGITLNDRQVAILKAFYSIDLEDKEVELLTELIGIDRTTWEPLNAYQALVIECGRRGGKCLRSDSIIIDRHLGLSYGYELLEKAMSIEKKSELLSKEKGLKDLSDITLDLNLTVAIEGKNKTAKTSDFYIKGISKTKKITTACGYELEATPEHRIKIIDVNGNIVWRYFQDIQVGEYACIHRNTNLFPDIYLPLKQFEENPKNLGHAAKIYKLEGVLDRRWGLLIGLLVANGSWFLENGIECTFHKQDEDYYNKVFKDVFDRIEGDIKWTIEEDKKSNFGCRFRNHSKYLRKCFHNLGFSTAPNIREKRIPWSIRRSPKKVQAAFLSGLFAGDGTLGKGGRDVSLSTASKFLAQEVQLMLLNFGIVSKVVTRKINGAGNGKDYYFVILRGKRSLIKFAEEITFGLPRKQEPLVEYLAKSSRDGGDTERIPYQKEWLQRIRESLPTNIGKQPGSHHGAGALIGKNYTEGKEKLRNLRLEFRKIVGNAIKENNNELLSSYRLDRIIEFAEEFSTDLEAINHFKYLRDCDYFYDPVVSAEDSEAFCVDLSVPGHEQYVAQGFTNHNSTLSSLIVAYEFYKLTYLPNPQRYYGIAVSTPISIIVMATSAEQAKRTIFKQVVGVFRVCKYFKPLIEKGKLFIGKEEITYDEKLLYVYSGNSQSSGQVGQSIILLVMDEVSRFKGEDGSENALELWSNVGISGVTFGTDARRIAISSAWYEKDAIEILYDKSKTEESWLGFRLRTWDLNPSASRDNPIISAEYNLNPKKAALEFEGIRAGSDDTFLDSDEVKRSFKGKSVIKVLTNKDDKSDELVRLSVSHLEKYRGFSYMHLDPSIVTDTYGLAFGHGEIDKEKELIVYIDGILGWEPENDKQVSITNVQNVIREIHKSRFIKKLTADHHNSAETLQRLKTLGIQTESTYFSNKLQLAMYEVLRSLMHEDRLVLPKDSPWTKKLQDELNRLVLIRNQKIDHMYGGSKDLADSVAGVCWLVVSQHKQNNSVGSVIGSTNNISPLGQNQGLNDPTFKKVKAKKFFQSSSRFT